MSIEITATAIVKYETHILYYDTFTIRKIIVTSRTGEKTEVNFYHMDDDDFYQPPIVYENRRASIQKKGTFVEDVEPTN